MKKAVTTDQSTNFLKSQTKWQYPSFGLVGIPLGIREEEEIAREI